MKQGLPIIALFCIFVCISTTGCMGIAPRPGPATPTPAVTTTGTSVAITDTVVSPGPRPPATPSEIMAYVDNAASWARQTGKTQALAAFGNASGPFVTGDVYIYALDFNGTVIAHPFFPQLVGVNRSNATDPNGVLYNEENIRIAQNGGGFSYYLYPNPLQNDRP